VKRALVLSAIAGAMVALAGPHIDAWPCALVGLALFACALEPDKQRRFEGAFRGLVFGTAVNVVVLRFVPSVIATFTPLPWAAGVLALVLLAASEALRWVVAAIVCVRLVRWKMPRFAAFAIGVWTGTFVPVVFPWTIAAGLTPWPALVQLGEFVGERGVTALLAATGGLLAEIASALREKDARRALVFGAAGVILPSLMFAFGALRMARVERERARAPSAKIALVQPDIEAHERWIEGLAPSILAKLSNLTRDAEAKGAEMTVWPEAAYPYRIATTSKTDLYGPFAILQSGVRGPVLTGLIMTDPNDGSAYNSAVVDDAGRLSVPYHKVHLLWFGETVPLADLSPWLRRTFARGMGLRPGERSVILPALEGRVRAAVLNCFEDTLPAAGREAFDGQSPNLLVNVTNDAWFYGSDESELHLRLAAMRSIELRRDLVRAVNRGPTSWVDATGRVRARYDLPTPGFLMASPALLETRPTLYARFGDYPVAILCAAYVAAKWKKGREKISALPEAS
jgi:apolipoprotein N-acyltransferase